MTDSREQDCFDKPIWTLRELASAAARVPAHARAALPTLFGRPLSNADRERIMLAVAAENRCRYCEAAHAAAARAAGVDDETVARLLERAEPAIPETERLVLDYVRDLARRGFRSHDPELRRQLAERLSDRELAAVDGTAHLMNFANRFGNTFDAALERARGRCERTAASWPELLLVSLGFAIGSGLVGPILGTLFPRLLDAARRGWRR
jgi:AhpD family alkylhydroperoxidase